MANLDKEISKLEQQKKLLEYKGEDRVVLAGELVAELRKMSSPFRLYSKLGGLDDFSDGFRKGNLIIVSAPTGQGKTTFCKTLTNKFNGQGVTSLWFSYEVPPEEFYDSFPEGNKIFTMPRELPTGALKWIEERILESKAKFNTDVVFIDHLHFLMEMKDLAIARNTSILIGMILRELKKIAIANDMVIFLIAHMKKKDTETQIPSIDDLRDSSFVAQESDMVLLLWRKQVEQSKEDIKNKIPPTWLNESVVSVVKNRRTGKLGYVILKYSEKKNEFVTEETADDWL